METWHYIVIILLSQVIIQIGLTKRRKIIESNKLKRIEKLENLNNSKIRAIGEYEKSSFWDILKPKRSQIHNN